MERRVFLAILLSFGVLYTYQALFVPPAPPPSRPADSGNQAQPSAGPPASNASPAPGVGSPPPVPEALPAAGAAPITFDTTERQITVETTTVQAVFSNRGGRLLRWRLKEYRDPSGEPVDLVPTRLPADQPAPFSLRLADRQQTALANQALYRVSGDTNARVDATAAPATLTFEYEDAGGWRVRKAFTFQPANYVVQFTADVRNGTETLNPALMFGPGLGDAGAAAGGGSYFTGNAIQPPEAILNRDSTVERVASASIAEQPAREGTFAFAGVDDHYFAAVAIAPGQSKFEFASVTLPGAEGTSRTMVAQTVTFAQPPRDVRFFLGPKQFDLLQAADPGLVRAINFGMFDVVVVPLLNTLKWLNGSIGNYGWSIVVLTIIINLAMFPLRHKSTVAMRKMQAIQPRMKAIQDRYAHLKMTDPARQKMNAEVTALYREAGANPASGCVPMLLTLPVLLAFYSLLSQAIELRGAPFTAWIQDLSAPDPYYVLPGLMGVSMFWQQRITPAALDPAQQRVMMIMPVMFTVMMLFSPSGVVLYWFISNVWTIGQQYFTNWLIGPPPVPARAAAPRELKNAGAGRTAGAQRAE